MQIFKQRSTPSAALALRRANAVALVGALWLAGSAQAQSPVGGASGATPGVTPGAATGATSAAPSAAPRASGGLTLRPVAPPEPVATTPGAGSALNQVIERLTVEGEGVTVNELRVGGETRAISVQPKGNFPAYSVQPRTGERNWKLFDF